MPLQFALAGSLLHPAGTVFQRPGFKWDNGNSVHSNLPDPIVQMGGSGARPMKVAKLETWRPVVRKLELAA